MSTYDEIAVGDLELLGKKPEKKTAPKVYKLGEEIANGVLYFGANRVEKQTLTCKCICPFCDESFRTGIKYVASGRTTHCGCMKGKKNAK